MLNSPTNAQRLPPSQSGQIGAKVAEAINMRVSKIKGQRGIPQCPYFMVRSERVELPTYWFVASCSIQLSYERVEGVIYLQTGGRSIPLLPPLPRHLSEPSTTSDAALRCVLILRHFRLEPGEIIIHTARRTHLVHLFLGLTAAIQRIIQRT